MHRHDNTATRGAYAPLITPSSNVVSQRRTTNRSPSPAAAAVARLATETTQCASQRTEHRLHVPSVEEFFRVQTGGPANQVYPEGIQNNNIKFEYEKSSWGTLKCLIILNCIAFTIHLGLMGVAFGSQLSKDPKIFRLKYDNVQGVPRAKNISSEALRYQPEDFVQVFAA